MITTFFATQRVRAVDIVESVCMNADARLDGPPISKDDLEKKLRAVEGDLTPLTRPAAK